jgi:hypothetical protein
LTTLSAAGRCARRAPRPPGEAPAAGGVCR